MFKDPVQTYIRQAAKYISINKGVGLDEATRLVKETLHYKFKAQINDPETTVIMKDKNNDRQLVELTLRTFLKWLRTTPGVVVPSLTKYAPPGDGNDHLPNYLNKNIKLRSVDKKIALQAKSEGNIAVFAYKWIMQLARKLKNNAISGTFGSKGTVLYNPSAHYTLTSMTRTLTSIGNATGERLINSNRHYHSKGIIFSDFLSAIEKLPPEKIRPIIDKYDLYLPNTHDVMTLIRHSSDRYFKSPAVIDELSNFIESTLPEHKAAFVYGGDLSAIAKFNPDIVDSLLTSMSARVKGDNETVEPSDVYSVDESARMLAHHIWLEEISGLGVDYDQFKEAGMLGNIYATSTNIVEALHKYKDFIDVLLHVDNMPITVATLPTMLRDVTVLSDTDSTCATYQDWVFWKKGRVEFTPDETGWTAAVMTLNTGTIAHFLRKYSENMGVATPDLGTLAMKNEFYWDVMVPFNVTKHYVANTRIQEGGCFKEPELEIKGAHLHASKAMEGIPDLVKKWLRGLLMSVSNGKGINLVDEVKFVSNLEESIREKLLQGDVGVYGSDTIKSADSYVQEPTRSKFRHFTMWEKVFADKYGAIAPPPYAAVKVPVSIQSKNKMRAWIDSIEDEDFKKRALDYLPTAHPNGLGMFLFNYEYIVDKGLPDEVRSIILVEDIIHETVKPFYMGLETLGYFVRDKQTITQT